MDRERKLKLIAVDKTIEYALQRGIKLRRSDFELELDYTSKELNLVQINHMLSGEQGVSVILRAVNRWKSMLLKKKESFLNYANARLINQDIVFQFSFRELNFFEMNQEPEEIDGKSMEKILSKIDRLLALADLDKNSNEHEAIAASMKAQELLAKYNLSIADVKGEKKDEEIEHVCADVKAKGSMKWKGLMGSVVAKSYRCKFYIVGAERFIFYGFKTDAIIARRVFIYLVNVCNKLGRAYVAELKNDGYNQGVKSALERNCTALALVVPEEVSVKFEELSANWQTLKSELKSHDRQAYQRGMTEGKRALNAQYIE